MQHYTEQNGLYANLEGRVQEGKKASYPVSGGIRRLENIQFNIKKRFNKQESILKFDELRKEALSKVKNFTNIK